MMDSDLEICKNEKQNKKERAKKDPLLCICKKSFCVAFEKEKPENPVKRIAVISRWTFGSAHCYDTVDRTLHLPQTSPAG